MRFQSTGSLQFSQFFEKNKYDDDGWDSERNMDEFTFGINDGDMLKEKAYKLFLTNDDFVLKSSEEA